MDTDRVRVIKISKEALFEFIYEKFNEDADHLFDVDSTEVSCFFDIDFEHGQFIYCAIQFEDEHGHFLTMPQGVDLQSLMKRLPDTTGSMFANQRLYREFTKDELIALSSHGESEE